MSDAGEAILALLSARAGRATICPSEVPRLRRFALIGRGPGLSLKL